MESATFNRIAVRAYGVRNFYLACDLDEGKVRYWPGAYNEKDTDLMLKWWCSRDFWAMRRSDAIRRSEYAPSIGIDLSESSIRHLKELARVDRLELCRGLDDQAMQERSGAFCYRDGWHIDFYAESDDGSVPINLKGITYCSFMGNELPFEEILDYLDTDVIHYVDRMGAYAHKEKPTKKEALAIAEKAVSVGASAVDEILWEAHPRVMHALGEIETDKEICYSLSDDSFTVHCGNEIVRSCKLHEKPRCYRVFGNEHVFN